MATTADLTGLVRRSNGKYSSISQWPIRAQYRMPAAKMAMRLISPRPDVETQAHARQKWAHPNMPYEVCVAVQGGNWPFKYEFISAPSGATIGAYYNKDKKGLINEYGNVRWTPTASSGTHTFNVRITDSSGTTIDVTWTVTIDATKFIFIQDGYAGTKVGTIDQPLESFADWYQNDVNDATYLGKIVVFRQGTYALVGNTDNSNSNVFFNNTTKSGQLIGWPDEIATIDCSNGKFLTNTTMPDIYISHLRFINARNDIPNAHYFWLTNKCDRSTFFKNHFDGMSYGTVGDDNAGPIFYADLTTGSHHQYAAIRDNLFEGIISNVGNGHYWDAYQMDYLIAEGNVSKDSHTNYGHWAKCTSSFICIRNNDVFDNCQGAGTVIGMGIASDVVPNNHEVCWNTFVVPVNQNAPIFEVAMSTGYQNQHYNTWIYRNTFVGGYTMVRFVGLQNYYIDANAILTNNQPLYDTSIVTTTIPNLFTSNSTEFDVKGVPTDPTKRFFVGHEVY